MRSDCFGSVSEARGVRSCPTARPHTTPVTLSCPQGCDAAVPNLRAAHTREHAAGVGRQVGGLHACPGKSEPLRALAAGGQGEDAVMSRPRAAPWRL